MTRYNGSDCRSCGTTFESCVFKTCCAHCNHATISSRCPGTPSGDHESRFLRNSWQCMLCAERFPA